MTEQAAKNLPRSLFIGLLLIYCLSGFIGREPFRPIEINQLGWLLLSLQDEAHPLKESAGFDALLHPEGFTAIAQWPFHFFSAPLAFGWLRLLSFLLLISTLCLTWFAAKRFASLAAAQPISFAFGGEAKPNSYAVTLADGSILALIASLGFSQFAHEFSPFLAQIFSISLLLFSLAITQGYGLLRLGMRALSLILLGISGAPLLSLILTICLLAQSAIARAAGRRSREFLLHLLLSACVVPLIIFTQDEALSRFISMSQPHGFSRILKHMAWFAWPIWPMVCWTLWKWRQHWWSKNASTHLLTPVLFSIGILLHAFYVGSNDRWYFLSLPPLSLLAALALPTLTRSVSSIVDWFTMLLFTGAGLLIWLFWIAGVTGFPQSISIQVDRLIPMSRIQFDAVQFGIALLASLAWLWLVIWRTGRHRAAIWKSLALPAGGAATCWVLLTTIWLPYLNQSRSMQELGQQMMQRMPSFACAYAWNLSTAQVFSLLYYGAGQPIYSATALGDQPQQCSLLFANLNALRQNEQAIDTSVWKKIFILTGNPTQSDDDLVIYSRH